VGLERVLAALERPGLKIGAAALVPALALGLGYARADRSSHTWARDFAARLLERLEPGALLFAEEDNVVFPLSYLHHVEGLRPDVELVMQGINRLDEMGIQPDRRPTYFTHPRDLGNPALELVSDGLAFRLVRAGSSFSGRPWQEAALASFEAVTEPGKDRYLDRSLVGNYYFLKAISLEPHDSQAALEAVRSLRRVSFDNAVNQVNAGLLLERNLRFEEAFDAFDTAAAIDPANDLAVRRARFWRETLARADAVGDAGQRAELLALALAEAGQVDLGLRVLDQARETN
jgi:tetratricopeptide (TPR) repeat protein